MATLPRLSGGTEGNRFRRDMYNLSMIVNNLIDSGALTVDAAGKLIVTSTSAPAFSGAFVTLSADLTMGNLTVYTVDFDTEQYDTDAFHNGGVNPSRFTIPVSGKYVCGVYYAFSPGAISGTFFATLKRNGTNVLTTTLTVNAAAMPEQLITPPLDCAAGDYFQITVQHSTGADSSLVSGTTAGTQFWIQKVG